MPPRLVEAGFLEHNNIVADSWGEIQPPQRQLFHPPLFRRLCHAVVPDVCPLPPPDDDKDPLNPIEITELVERFKEAIEDNLVDIGKIKTHVAANSLGKKRSPQHEKKGQREIDRVVHQVSLSCFSSLLQFFGSGSYGSYLCVSSHPQLKTINTIFGIEFHLLVSSFNPDTTQKKALWADEYTSCDRWAEHGFNNLHLLEDFSRYAHAVQPAPHKITRRKKPQTNPTLDSGPKLAPLAVLRPQLTAALNGLVRKSCVLIHNA